MSLQTAIADWRDIYDETEINAYKPAYIGSICDVNGIYHTGNGIYDPSATPPTYSIYEFNWYAGQGVDHGTPSYGGGKFLVGSTAGFSWDTTYTGTTYTFTTSGDLNTLYLGYTPSGDYGASPASSTLTAFDPGEPLLVVTGFNIAVDWVAANVIGTTGDTGNTLFNVASLVDDNSDSILANEWLYSQATLNSAVLYSLAFDNTNTQTFEYVLDKYLESKGSDITDSFNDIATALTGTGVSITYYDYAAGHFPDCDCDTETAAAEVDLLLAA